MNLDIVNLPSSICAKAIPGLSLSLGIMSQLIDNARDLSRVRCYDADIIALEILRTQTQEASESAPHIISHENLPDSPKADPTRYHK